MLNIDPWNMVMIVINLLVLYAIFRKFLYKPVMNVIHQREELIQGQFDSAKKTQDDALALWCPTLTSPSTARRSTFLLTR